MRYMKISIIIIIIIIIIKEVINLGHLGRLFALGMLHFGPFEKRPPLVTFWQYSILTIL